MTYKVLSCGTPLQGNAEAGKVIVEGKVQLPSINPGETGTARFELPDSFRKGDLSFLLDIPAICSFKPIEQQGPNSQPGNIRIKSGDEGLHLNLMFDFR